MAMMEGVDRMLESLSSTMALRMPRKLSPSLLMLPKAAINPWVLSSEVVAKVLSVALSPLWMALPVIASRSGLLVFWNRVMPMGIFPSFDPEKIISTPRFFAAVSDNSTIIASTRT